jgi:hypothetical protein
MGSRLTTAEAVLARRSAHGRATMPLVATRRPTTTELKEAAAVLRQVIALAESGELEAKSPNARTLLRKLEGAAIAAEIASGERPPPR